MRIVIETEDGNTAAVQGQTQAQAPPSAETEAAATAPPASSQRPLLRLERRRPGRPRRSGCAGAGALRARARNARDGARGRSCGGGKFSGRGSGVRARPAGGGRARDRGGRGRRLRGWRATRRSGGAHERTHPLRCRAPRRRVARDGPVDPTSRILLPVLCLILGAAASWVNGELQGRWWGSSYPSTPSSCGSAHWPHSHSSREGHALELFAERYGGGTGDGPACSSASA